MALPDKYIDDHTVRRYLVLPTGAEDYSEVEEAWERMPHDNDREPDAEAGIKGRWYGQWADVTERFNAEAELRAAEAALRLLEVKRAAKAERAAVLAACKTAEVQE